MARKRPAYRKKRHNRLGMLLVMMCIVMLLIVVSVSSIDLKAKQRTYAERERNLAEQIEQEHERTRQLEEYEKYIRTDAYIEEVAKSKLGLVYEGEIIFRADD
ncbi:MAG: septum formation initiator family protein [Lachnospiraceae bacterium]|nr:septum formation initiator family protein [Lachnospiraceae bacterium]MBD5481516.1 septum formation initiator family protein [Lachnospiraceae bacterium]MBD5531958.1 septum formation initiator family protein [Lachnospiraceae bacterium]MDE5818066.1 septum formation initiator family protein [Lachnospiraceae bacterium]